VAKALVADQTIEVRPEDSLRLGDVAQILGKVVGRRAERRGRDVVTGQADGHAAFAAWTPPESA